MRLLGAIAAAFAAVAVLAASATAGTSTVSVVGCAKQGGGQATVPAGDTVVFRLAWVARNDALAGNFLRAVQTTASIDGEPIANAGSYWTAPAEGRTSWIYSTGTPLAAGQSMTITYDAVLAHAVTDGFPSQGGGVAHAGSIFGGALTCTVTAV